MLTDFMDSSVIMLSWYFIFVKIFRIFFPVFRLIDFLSIGV